MLRIINAQQLLAILNWPVQQGVAHGFRNEILLPAACYSSYVQNFGHVSKYNRLFKQRKLQKVDHKFLHGSTDL